MNAKVDFKFHW